MEPVTLHSCHKVSYFIGVGECSTQEVGNESEVCAYC